MSKFSKINSKLLPFSRLCFAGIFAILFSNFVIAQKTLVLSPQSDVVNLGNYCSFYIDSSNYPSPKNAINAWKKGDFTFYNKYAKSFGITKSTVWCVFCIENTSSKEYYLELEKTRLDSIEIFTMQKDSSFKKEYSGGNKFPFSKRLIAVNNFIYPLNNQSQQPKVFLLKFKGNYIMEFPLKVYSFSKLIESKHLYDLFDGVYIGLIIIIIFYNLFVFFAIREKVHLFYSFYVLFAGSMVLYFKGYAYEFVFPNHPIFNSYLSTLPTLVTLSAVLFLFSFLDSKRNIPVLHKLFYVFMAGAVIAFCINLAGFEGLAMTVVELVSLFTTITILIAGIVTYRKGIKHAKLYVIAWSVFLIGVIIYILKDFNIVPYNDFTCNTIQIGSAFEIIIITTALAQKMNYFKEEKERNQILSINNLLEKERVIMAQNLELGEKNIEKEVMLKEIHHRVKNNLAIVSGILYLQSSYSSNEELKQVLNDCTNRIKSMGLIHESLYEFEKFSGIEYDEYLKNLTNDIQNSFPNKSKNIELKLNIEKIVLEVTTAIPCGLMITEVLSNTYKHAFKNRDTGLITISFKKIEDDFELIIKDNGVGMDFDKSHKTDGLGMSLIEAFSSQLGGTYRFNNDSGSEFRIVFPVKK